MTISILLRLSKGALVAGHLAGEAEVIATGERRPIASADDLISFVAQGSLVGPMAVASPQRRARTRGSKNA